jgi:hypothetical protein
VPTKTLGTINNVNSGTAITFANGDTSERLPNDASSSGTSPIVTASWTRAKFRDRSFATDSARRRYDQHNDRTKRKPCAHRKRRERIDDQHRDQREAE